MLHDSHILDKTITSGNGTYTKTKFRYSLNENRFERKKRRQDIDGNGITNYTFFESIVHKNKWEKNRIVMHDWVQTFYLIYFQGKKTHTHVQMNVFGAAQP